MEQPEPRPEAPSVPSFGPPSGAGPDPEVRELATRMFAAARAGDAETLAAYVDAGVPVELTNQNGDTLLMLAAYHGHAPAVLALTERGADPNLENDKGQRPLAGAVFKREPDVVRALLDAGADPFGGTPSAAETARMFGNADFLEWFGAPPS